MPASTTTAARTTTTPRATAAQAAALRRYGAAGFAARILTTARATALIRKAGSKPLGQGALYFSYIPAWEQGRTIGGAYCKGPGRSYLMGLTPQGGLHGHGATHSALPSIQLSGPQLAPGQMQGTQAKRFTPPTTPRKRKPAGKPAAARKPAGKPAAPRKPRKPAAARTAAPAASPAAPPAA